MQYSFAQVSIGITSPDASSILDLTSISKGLLAPRMTQAQKTAIASPATGLLIFQTDGTAGFYFYTGSSWIPLLANNTGWNTVGNAGTTAGTNFIGTSDAIDFVTKTNGAEVMRATSAGNVGIGTTSPGSKLDVKGTLRLSGSTSGYVGLAPAAAAGSTTYTLPSSDGTSGQLLTTNGSGTLSWGTPLSIVVSASRTSTYTTASSYATVVYNSASINVGTAYNTSTGDFTAPATGIYQIIVSNMYSTTNAATNGLNVRIVVNGSTETEVSGEMSPYSSATDYRTINAITIVSVTSGQIVKITMGGLVGTMTPTVGTGQHTLKIIRLN